MNSTYLRHLFLLTLLQAYSIAASAEKIDDPCGGAAALLNLIDRPTAADSACVVPFKHVVFESGYQYQSLTHSAFHEQNYPEAEFRLGLPANNEFTILFPNHIHQSMQSQTGFTAMTVGLKHEIGYTEHWLGAVEALFILPNGSAAFGSNELGATFNGIISYNYNPKFNVTFMFGGSTQSQPSQAGGGRFTTINPDLVLTYAPIEKINFYVECYGQSKTAPNAGSGFNVDGGMTYLLLPRMALDVELGQRLSGNLDGFRHYYGAGMALFL